MCVRVLSSRILTDQQELDEEDEERIEAAWNCLDEDHERARIIAGDIFPVFLQIRQRVGDEANLETDPGGDWAEAGDGCTRGVDDEG